MIKLLEQAITEITKLPEAQQETFAQWILDELEDDARWDRAFADSLSQLEQLGQKALQDYQEGRTQYLDPDTLE